MSRKDHECHAASAPYRFGNVLTKHLSLGLGNGVMMKVTYERRSQFVKQVFSTREAGPNTEHISIITDFDRAALALNPTLCRSD